MAFPTGYLKFQSITIDHTKVAGDLTDYIVYVNLADLVKAGADIFDTCRTDGGDIRATKNDGTTELAVEVVAIDTTAKTGEVHIKFSGTLSSSTDTVIKIWYNGTDTMPATTDTYGRNAVWTGYDAVYHLKDTTDYTGNGKTLTDTGTVPYTTSAKLGKGADFTPNDALNNNSIGSFSSPTYPRTVSIIGKFDTIASDRALYALGDGATHYYALKITGASLLVFRSNNLTEAADVSTGVTVSTGTYYHATVVQHSTTSVSIHVNGTKTNAAATTFVATAVSQFFLGYLGRSSAWWLDGLLDETRVAPSAKSDNWAVTEYNNQSSASTFYSTSAEGGGSTTVSPSAQALTFSLPAESVTGSARVSVAAQVGTLSLPTRTVRANWKVNVNTQVATFTIPAYVVQAQGVMVLPEAQVLTFSLPTETILGSAIVSPTTQSLTFTVPASAVSANWSVGVSPAVLTITLPALEFVGALWGRTARATSGADWTRSVKNDS